MTIPVPIELEFVIPDGATTYKPRLFSSESDELDDFLEALGIDKTSDLNPEGYMFWHPPEPQTHTYTIKATANGHPVGEFNLYITDDVSMATPDPAEEQELFEKDNQHEYEMAAGYPKKDGEDDEGRPLAGPKKIKFRATKEGYKDSDTLLDEVIVLGDVSEGSAQKIISIPIVNYTVLHDPPGDGSYCYLDDSMTIKGMVRGLQLKLNDREIPVYPSPWSNERAVKDFDFEFAKEGDAYERDFKDMKDKGLLGYRNSDPTAGRFILGAAIESLTGAGVVALGPFGFAAQLAQLGVKVGVMNVEGTSSGIVQFEVSPNRHLETPSGDELADLLGPGKGDIYFGEGWTLGLQTKHRMGIAWDENNQEWNLNTQTIETYDIMDRTNQYIYTARDIEKLVANLEDKIEAADDEDEKKKLEEAKGTWQELLDNNVAYEWQHDYVDEEGEKHDDFEEVLNDGDDILDEFIEEKGGKLKSDHDDGNWELLIISGGPTFEYSRAISASHTVSYSTEVSLGSSSEPVELNRTAINP